MSFIMLARSRKFAGCCFYVKRTIMNRMEGTSSNQESITEMNWKDAKEALLKMPNEKRRRYYKCGKNFVCPGNIPTWKEYFQRKESEGSLLEKMDNTNFQIDPKNNENLASKISIFEGNIVTLEIDAIVNAANKTLLGGGGVDGAIHRAAGTQLREECSLLRGCKVGEAKITSGYQLPAKYVIHTVGPQGEHPDQLASCYRNCLQMLLNEKLRTIAFPCISTGIYGYPQDKAAQVACAEVRRFLERHDDQVDRVIFCLFLREDQVLYESLLQSYFPIE